MIVTEVIRLRTIIFWHQIQHLRSDFVHLRSVCSKPVPHFSLYDLTVAVLLQT